MNKSWLGLACLVSVMACPIASAQGNSNNGGGGSGGGSGSGGGTSQSIEIIPDAPQTATVTPTLATITNIPFDRYLIFQSEIVINGNNNDRVDFSISYALFCSLVFGEYRAIFIGSSSNLNSTDNGVLAGVRVINPDGSYIYHQSIENFPDYIEDFSRECSNNIVTLKYNNFRIRNQSSKNTFTVQLHYDNNSSVLTSSVGTLITVGADGEPLAGTYNLDLLVSLL